MKKKTKIIIAAVCGVCIAGMGIAYWGYASRAKEPAFTAKNPAELREYMEKNKNLSDEQRHQVVRHSLRKIMDEKVDQYYKLPPEERTQFLDEIIDEMQKHKKEREGRPTNGGHKRKRDVSRMRQRLENGDAADRARRSAFREALRARAQERGVQR